MNKEVKEQLFTAILVFILGFGCGALWVLRMSDPKTFMEKYHGDI